jgi:hypothetical protein
MRQNKTIEIVGIKTTLEEFTLDTRVQYAGWVTAYNYKALNDKIIGLSTEYSELEKNRNSPLAEAKAIKLEKEYHKLSDSFKDRLDSTPLEGFTPEFEAETERLATELQAKADELRLAINPAERMQQIAQEFDEVQRKQRELDLKFFISLVEDDENKAAELYEDSKTVDSVLANQWVKEGNALLTRSQNALAVPLNREQRRNATRRPVNRATYPKPNTRRLSRLYGACDVAGEAHY